MSSGEFLIYVPRGTTASLHLLQRFHLPYGVVNQPPTNRTALGQRIVIRKDGREIGRERVSDLRGALHHYGPATAGWLISTGQVLSGAREEAAAVNAAPVALYDGMALCKLLEESEVAVIRAKYPIATPDLDFLDMLRG